MKKLLLVVLITTFYYSQAQTNSELVKHYKAYYKAMKSQGDVRGAINALTHLSVLEPTQAKKDTLAYLYMSDGKHMQALNTIGIQESATDSDMAIEVKALCLKTLNQPAKAIPFFEEIQKRNPSVLIAYELADLKVITNDLDGAMENVEYGLANAKDEFKINYYETQYPYQVSSRAAFKCLKGLVSFKKDPSNVDGVIALMDEAIAIEPNFNLAKISKEALLKQKTTPSTTTKN